MCQTFNGLLYIFLERFQKCWYVRLKLTPPKWYIHTCINICWAFLLCWLYSGHIQLCNWAFIVKSQRAKANVGYTTVWKSYIGINFAFNFFVVITAMEYHNLNTSIATRDFWVVTGRDIIAYWLLKSELCSCFVSGLFTYESPFTYDQYSNATNSQSSNDILEHSTSTVLKIFIGNFKKWTDELSHSRGEIKYKMSPSKCFQCGCF